MLISFTGPVLCAPEYGASLEWHIVPHPLNVAPISKVVSPPRDRRGTERKGTERVPPVPFPERNGTGTQNQGTQRNGNPKLGNVGTRSVPLRSPILNIFLINFSLKRIQKVKNFAYGVNNDKSDIIIGEIENLNVKYD